eukprot:gnl/TRDRNA2_/TRDRNA2_173673_c0_seq10.p1 gnl/TRDRNA2_/TRDRNA2_173673_c0~~gnl/TRDRNA2_/TRDRNA2_173673_c0_seq10.p1  ORF type:complete len:207 (+),score=59.07 gnl/TRDRNA2_/TRDRNA2_173673_c0_seq10:77-697(+)
MSLRGVIKNYDHNKGYGFITYEGEEVFLHVSNLAGAPPNKGDTVMFDMEPNPQEPGKMIAKNVAGGSGAGWIKLKYHGGENLAVTGTGKNVGVVKNFSSYKSGWGFITFEGKDIFVHVKDCVGSRPQEGDVVQFDLEPGDKKDGSMKAVNVTGGTVPLTEVVEKGKGKGKGKGYGKWEADPISMAMAWMFGGGMGKGSGKGGWGWY